jgi:hypothetical protein
MKTRVKSYQRTTPRTRRRMIIKAYVRRKPKGKGKKRIIDPIPVIFYNIRDEFGHIVGRTTVPPDEYEKKEQKKNVKIKKAGLFKRIDTTSGNRPLPSHSKINVPQILRWGLRNKVKGQWVPDKTGTPVFFETQELATKALDRLGVPAGSQSIQIAPVREPLSHSHGTIGKLITKEGEIKLLGDIKLTNFITKENTSHNEPD